MKCDVLILGAGLAGCACARQLALAGKSVLVIDRVDLSSKDKLCGGLLTPRAVRVLERLYGEDVRGVYTCEHRQMRVMVAAHDRVVDGVRVVGTQRRDVDRYVVEQARRAGVRMYDQARVTTLDIPRGEACFDTPEGQLEVVFDDLVAADGAVSWTRKEACRQYAACVGDAVREPRFARPREAEVIPSLEAYVEPSGQPLSGKYDAHLHGYGWYVPCGAGGNIGFDGKNGTTRAELRAALDAFSQEMGVAIEDENLRGAFIPSGGTVLLQLGGPGVVAPSMGLAEKWPHAVYFLGDAAGMAAPATGEGIYFALRSAEMLAISLVRHTASYRSLMSGEASTLERQYAMLDVLFNEDLMEKSMSFSHVSGVGPDRMARFALKLFASF